VLLGLIPYRTASHKTHDLIVPDFETFYYESVRRFVKSQCKTTGQEGFLPTLSNISVCVKHLAETKGARPIQAERVTDIDFIKFFSRKENDGLYKLECAAYTSLLKAALTSYGFYVRRVDLSDFDYEKGGAYRFLANFTASSSSLLFKRHQVLEIWDAQRSQWIFWDGFYNLYAVDGNRPISVVEIQDNPSAATFVKISNNKQTLQEDGYRALFRQAAFGKILDSEYEMQLHAFSDEMGPAYRSFEWRTSSESQFYRALNWEFRDYYSDDRDSQIRKLLASLNRH
jgi:hypothetical protein